MSAMFNKHGFTIPEILVVIAVFGIVMGLVFTALGDFYYANVQTTAQTAQDTETRGVLRKLEATIVDAKAFEPTITVQAPQGPGNNTTSLTWSYKGNDTSAPDNRVFIATTLATDKAATDATRLPVFQNTGFGCSIAQGSPVNVRSIYFVALAPGSSTQKNLYKRTVVMPTATLCGTPYQKNTCAASVVAANPTVCQATDATLLTNVTNFTIDYYASPNDTAAIANQYSTTVDVSSAIAAAKTAKLTVTTVQKINGKDATSIADIRVSRSY